jgi:hypothetical protein
MLNQPVTVSRRPLASVLALVAMSVFASAGLTACDAAAEHRPMASAQPVSLVSLPPATVAASAPAVSQGAAALHEHREDLDPSHAAIATYRD